MKAGRTRRGSRWVRIAKPVFDRVVAAVALIALAPVLAVVALAVWKNLGSPVIFRQRRVGQHGSTFELYKFRTMRGPWTRPNGAAVTDELRVTRLGRLLRSTSLDELPELVNVVRGDMSLVGPRPLLPEYVPLYTPHQTRRHEVKPGITGWAAVNGRNTTSWEQRFDLDVWYVDHASFLLDVRILFMTVIHVVARRDVSPDGQLIMPRFIGTSSKNVKS
jgi:sugar transferase EpsL